MKLKEISTPIITKKVVKYDSTGNKAVYHNKDIRPVTDNIYIGEAEGSEYYRLYPIYAVYGNKIGLYLGTLNDYENVETIENLVSKNKLSSFDSYIDTVLERIDKNRWINCVEMEYVKNYRPDLVANINVARSAWKSHMEEQRKEIEAEKNAKRQEEIKADNERAKNIIESAIAVFKNGGTLENDNITIRNENDYFDVKTRSIINYLLDEHNIPVPIRTRGFINEKLASITVSSDLKGVSYSYFKRGNSKGSQKIYGLIYSLIDKINDSP